jgi:hypothetical protein
VSCTVATSDNLLLILPLHEAFPQTALSNATTLKKIGPGLRRST